MKQGLKQTVKALVVMCFFGGLSMTMGQDKPAKPRVVIVCGEDWKGHIWQETAPRLRQIINSKNEYDVRIVEDITFLGTDRLASYDVLVMHFKNYNPLPNDAQARANVQAFVENGGGLVAIHWANGAFTGWEEFRKMIGMVFVDKVSMHDKRGPFTVTVIDDAHPITQGLTDFQTDDELYYRLDRDASAQVLATANSVVSGQVEPMALVTHYGKGRVFHTPLGHDLKGLSTPETELLIYRGTAWAAGLLPDK